MIGLDTCAIIDLFRGNESLRKLLRDLKESVALTQISHLEIFFGIDPENNMHKFEEEYYNEFFSSFSNYYLNDDSIKMSRDIFWRLKKKGKIIDQFDCVIAGIFLSNGVNKIITRNVKHFENIDAVNVITY